jgi:glycosyltransferase involved in cell wall biosynthesis
MAMPAKIYHLHDPELIPVGHLLRVVMRAKIIYDCREDYINYIKIRPGTRYIERSLLMLTMRFLEWSAAKYFDAIITADQATEQLYKKYGAFNTLIIHNFPRINYFPYPEFNKPENEKTFDLVYYGSISSYYLKPAFCIASELKKRKRKIRWLFFGNIPELDWAYSEIERRGIKDFFTFEPRIPHEKVANKLAFCKIGIVHLPDLPKLRNNISQKLFEFLAMGMPVIVSDLPGMRPFVKDKPYAILVPADDYKAYADAIIYLLDNPVRRQQMGFAARKQIENYYNWDIEFRKLKDFYHSLLEE